MTRLDALEGTAPAWFSRVRSSAMSMRGTARVQAAGSADDATFDLEVVGGAAGVRVGEVIRGAALPAFCPERHINPDGSFCLGLRAGEAVVDADSAEIWWDYLHRFLELQRVASNTGLWPDPESLDHGDAGEHHAAALLAARDLGIEEEYELARMGEPSWMTEPLPRTDAAGRRVLNGRAPCPRGCTHAGGRPWLRRACARSASVTGLLHHERLRRKELAAFWRRIADSGLPCCGTMAACPMRRWSKSPSPTPAGPPAPTAVPGAVSAPLRCSSGQASKAPLAAPGPDGTHPPDLARSGVPRLPARSTTGTRARRA